MRDDSKPANLPPLGFFARLWLAFLLFWKLLFDGALAAEVGRLTSGEATKDAAAGRSDETPAGIHAITPVSLSAAAIPAIPASERDPTTALQLLTILQREGRFIDFLQEDVSGFSDGDVGAAARVVHDGCNRALREYVELSAVRPENEGETVLLEAGFDADRTRLTGRVVGNPPFRGRLAHHGWQVTTIQLPSLTDGHDPKVVAPAEVELS